MPEINYYTILSLLGITIGIFAIQRGACDGGVHAPHGAKRSYRPIGPEGQAHAGIHHVNVAGIAKPAP